MIFKVQLYWEDKKDASWAAPLLAPLTIVLASIEELRAHVLRVAANQSVPIHSFVITAEDGHSERWFQLNGTWRRKDV